MSANQLALWYLAASVLFILALKGLSSPVSARRGNLLGVIGMAIAVLVTLAITKKVAFILVAAAIGGMIGAFVARRVQMTQMPELVAAMHSLVGMAAVLIAIAVVNNPSAFGIPDPMPRGNRLELFIGSFIGAITFSGSVIAFGKLAGLGKKFRLFSSAPVVFRAQHPLNLALAVVMVGFGAAFFLGAGKAWEPFLVMLAIAFVLGVLIIIPIGGADMPVVISMLNSYSGWAAAGIGFSLNNTMLIIAGSLVGSSGAILSYIMCKAMNRSFISVIMGGFGAAEGAAPASTADKTVRSGSAEDAAFLLANAETVVIVPGYGLAVARAQHAVKEMAQKLIAKGVNVRYAIHPVAGRMPGHMNVLLAEAEVPYEQVFEMEDINGELGTTDVVLVLGANDVVNPLAHEKGSPIYGMPIIEAHKARTVLVNKRSMAAGYAGLDNPLFYMEKTMMVFGDAKKVVEDIVKALE
ncbi:MAG TPA: NAD(P)(+) transhydrogenase (Re/Si-specific) subunit beta [Burkholderiales bacterium]|jgi:proton-translocating NAD(P)+ transhydrogenase subunit beta|nr:NAD(P)(+) transhydrogenase (Re/Si-specific) subunit beta [Burkholderiales bacterium]